MIRCRCGVYTNNGSLCTKCLRLDTYSYKNSDYISEEPIIESLEEYDFNLPLDEEDLDED